MDYRPKQYYVTAQPVPVAPIVEEERGLRIYFRNEDGSLGMMRDTSGISHKDSIMDVKEQLVAGGDCLTNKPVLALIEGGKK